MYYKVIQLTIINGEIEKTFFIRNFIIFYSSESRESHAVVNWLEKLKVVMFKGVIVIDSVQFKANATLLENSNSHYNHNLPGTFESNSNSHYNLAESFNALTRDH